MFSFLSLEYVLPHITCYLHGVTPWNLLVWIGIWFRFGSHSKGYKSTLSNKPAERQIIRNNKIYKKIVKLLLKEKVVAESPQLTLF